MATNARPVFWRDPGTGALTDVWWVPIADSGPLLLTGINRRFWFDYGTNAVSLLNDGCSIANDAWTSEHTTVFTFEDDLLAIPLGVANQHAPLLISSATGRMYVVTAEEQRPVLPLTPLEALTERVSFYSSGAPNTMYEVNIPRTTPDNVGELVEIRWDNSVFMYSRRLQRLVQDGEIVQPLPPSLVDYPSSTEDEEEADDGNPAQGQARTDEAGEGNAAEELPAEEQAPPEEAADGNAAEEKAPPDEAAEGDAAQGQARTDEAEEEHAAEELPAEEQAPPEEAADGDDDQGQARTQDGYQEQEVDEEEDEDDHFSVVPSSDESDDNDADDEDTVVVDPDNVEGTEKSESVIWHQGWKKEYRKRQAGFKAGRVEAYLIPPNTKLVLRSYNDLRKWMQSQGVLHLPFKYDWTTINFDKVGSNEKSEVAKEAFFKFAQQFAEDYDNSPKELNHARSLPHFYYQDKVTPQERTRALIQTATYFGDEVTRMLQCLKGHKVPYFRRRKAAKVVKASKSLCQEAEIGLRQEPTREFAGLEEVLDQVLQELVLVRIGAGQSEQEAKKFFDSDVEYVSNFSDLSAGEGEPAKTKRKRRKAVNKRKRRKAVNKRKPKQAQTVPNDTSEEGEDDDDSGLRPQPTTSKRKRRKATIKRKLAKVRVTASTITAPEDAAANLTAEKTPRKRKSVSSAETPSKKRKSVSSAETPSQPIPMEGIQPTPRMTSGKKLTPRLRWREMGTAFQFPCPDCGRAMRTKHLWNIHRHQCVQCPTCGKWSDQRHADRCKTYKNCQVCGRWASVGHKCIGKKAVASKRIFCCYCSTMFSKRHMYMHFKNTHGRNWRRREYPECMSEEEYRANLERENELKEKERQIEELKANQIRLQKEVIQIKSAQLKSNKEDLKNSKAVLAELQNK